MSDDLDALFRNLLGPDALVKNAGPKPKAHKKITYATDYAWRLESFTAVIYSTLCANCGEEELHAGEIFRRSVGRQSGNLVSMVRIAGLHELASHPSLPRRVEVKRSQIMACPTCVGKLGFVAHFTEVANAEEKESRPAGGAENQPA